MVSRALSHSLIARVEHRDGQISRCLSSECGLLKQMSKRGEPARSQAPLLIDWLTFALQARLCQFCRSDRLYFLLAPLFPSLLLHTYLLVPKALMHA